MKLSIKRLQPFGLSLVFSAVLLGQTVIDATGPIRERLRNPTAGSGGTVGRKLPLQIAVEFASQPNADGSANVTFNLTNRGKTQLLLPIWLHPRDFEPEDKHLDYVVQDLHLYLTTNPDQGPIVFFGDGAHLYGSVDQPSTFLTVPPGHFLQVFVRIQVPHGLEKGNTTLVGHASLVNETIRTVDQRTFEDTQEIGSTVSPSYPLKPLLDGQR